MMQGHYFVCACAILVLDPRRQRTKTLGKLFSANISTLLCKAMHVPYVTYILLRKALLPKVRTRFQMRQVVKYNPFCINSTEPSFHISLCSLVKRTHAWRWPACSRRLGSVARSSDIGDESVSKVFVAAGGAL